MKKFLSLVLAALLLVSVTAFVLPTAQAADAELLYTISITKFGGPYADSCKIKGMKEDGKTSLRVLPNTKDPAGSEVVIDFFNLNIPVQSLEGATHMTVDYKYVCPEDTRTAASKMKLLMMPNSGALNAWINIQSATTIKEGAWDSIIFNLGSGEFEKKLVVEDGLLFKQFHLYPFGSNVNPKDFTKEEMLYLGDIKFWKGEPTVETTAVAGGQRGEAAEEAAKRDSLLTEGTDPNTQPLFVLNMQDISIGSYYGKESTKEKVEDEGKRALKVTPNIEENEGLASILIDNNPNILARDIKDVRYIVFNYKYVCPAETRTAGTKMNLLIMPHSGALKGWYNQPSATAIKENRWDKCIFNVNQFASLVDATSPTTKLTQWHLNPFGSNIPASSFTPGEYMLLGDVEFWAVYPDAEKEYTASFTCRIGQAEGTSPKSIINVVGTEYTLPENPYTLEGGTFLGWKSSADDQIYQPGAQFKLAAANVTYTAEFDYTPVGAPPFMALNFADYQAGVMDNKKTATCETTSFEGKDVYKVVPNPSFVDPNGGKPEVVVDGFSYNNAKIDLSKYQFMAVTYYIDGTLPETEEDKPIRFGAGFSKVGNYLTDYYMGTSTPIKTGSWQIATFDLSGIATKLNPDMATHCFQQIHFRPFNGIPVAQLTGINAVYINQIMFFQGSEVELVMNEAYMQGYDGGLFKPSATMTRAEAVTTVARLAAGGDELVPAETASRFADVPAGKWYTKYVTYVDSLGYLGSYSGNFIPNQNITRAEFVELVYNMGLLADKGANGTFTDVAADHPRAAVIAAAGKAGLVNGYDNGDGTFSFKPDATITRAEVVKVINNAYGRSVAKDMISGDVLFLHYDVPTTSWTYPEIASAVLPHVAVNGQWICTMLNPKYLLGGNARVDLKEGAAFVDALDTTTAKRVEEIRNTPNMDFTGKTGTTYYVSDSTGNDSNDGRTPETAWKTLTKVSRMQDSVIKTGDRVLFKRGDMWRGQQLSVSVAGVTYSAYGEGAKPIFNVSPEDGALDPAKWSLYIPELPNIWVYETEMIDVGGITFNYKSDNPKWGYKEVPDLLDGKFYVRGTKQTEEFKITMQFDNDLDFFCDVRSNDFRTAKGKIYLRCDEGNPAEVFDSIEFLVNNHAITKGGTNDITIDNICILFAGAHGIASGTTKNLTVTNCEIGWIGGGIQYYQNSNYGLVRFGNGVEIYGGAENYNIDNCYVYQCYDAGVTHQMSGNEEGDIRMDNITYSNNVIEDCIYSIEHFLIDPTSGVGIREGKNVLIENNILRRAGYGFGCTRPNGWPSTHIQGNVASGNRYEPGTFIVKNNIFDRSTYTLTTSYAQDDKFLPIFDGNTYIQMLDRNLAFYNTPRLLFDSVADYTIRLKMHDENAKVYWVDGKDYGFDYLDMSWR